MVTNSPLRPAKTEKWLLLAIVLGILLLLGFYNVGNSEAIPHDHLLEGGDFVSAAICHRLSSRSFAINGRPFPLCARCSGMYLGILLSFLLLAASGRHRWGDFPPTPILLILLGFVAIMGVDGVNSYSHFFEDIPHLYTPRNWLRLLTGMGTGLAMGVVMFSALAQTLWQNVIWQPVIGSWRELGTLILLGLTTVVLILSNQPTILYVLALLSVAGILMIFASINSMLLLILTKREGRLISWRQAIFPLSIGLMLALIELGTITTLRLTAFGTISGVPGIQ